MRKKIFIAAAIILLLLLSFFGWLQYRQYSSWKVPVHKDMQTVARINTDDLVWNFIKEYGFNFSKKIKKKNSKSSDSTKNTGIYFPGNIFVYNISSRQPSTFFCTLPVYDLPDFKAYAKSRFDIQLSDSAGFSKGISKDGRLSLAGNKSYITIAYSVQKEEVMSVMMEILSENNRLAEHKLYVAKLKEGKNTLSATNGYYSFTANIEGKKLLLTGDGEKYSKIHSLFSSKLKAADKEAFAAFSANIFPERGLFEKEYHIKQYSLDTDSVLNYYDGHIAIDIGPAISQYDTLTTYEYDDNFEKVERQTIQEVKVPDIHLQVSAKPGLVAYLQKQQFITSETKLNREIFPLYEVTVASSNGWLHLNTNGKKAVSAGNLVSSKNFMDGYIDAKKTIAALGLPSLERYIDNVHSLRLTGKRSNGGTIIEATVEFEHAAIRDITTLLKSL